MITRDRNFTDLQLNCLAKLKEGRKIAFYFGSYTNILLNFLYYPLGITISGFSSYHTYFKREDSIIQIAKEILPGNEPMIEYHPPLLELDAFFQHYWIALEVQVAQHWFHSTSWYKDVKKLKDIINRDRKKQCICQDIGISLLEVWYDEKPEIVIPERIQKLNQASKSFDFL